MKLRYFSHSGFQITTNEGQRILIDPFLDGNPTSPVNASDIEADFILITHGHGDHLGDTLDIAKRCNLVYTEDKTIYHMGDTGLFSDLKLIGEMNKVDLMLAPIGDNFTMGIEDAVKACEFVRPKMVIPIHYNTFPVIKTDPGIFKQKVEHQGIACQILAFGQEITL